MFNNDFYYVRRKRRNRVYNTFAFVIIKLKPSAQNRIECRRVSRLFSNRRASGSNIIVFPNFAASVEETRSFVCPLYPISRVVFDTCNTCGNAARFSFVFYTPSPNRCTVSGGDISITVREKWSANSSARNENDDGTGVGGHASIFTRKTDESTK